MAGVQETLSATEGLENVISVAGYSLLQSTLVPSGGFALAALAPWGEREEPHLQLDAILSTLRAQFATVAGATIAVFVPPAISGHRLGGRVRPAPPGASGSAPEEIAQVARSFVAAINQAPEIGSASTTFAADVPQIFVNIDGTRAETLGLSVGEIYSTIGANLGSRYVNDFTLQGRVYQVNLTAGADYRSAAEDILNLYARNDAGKMVPLRTVASTTTVLAPYVISRYNLSVAAPINGQAAADPSSGAAIGAIEQMAAETLPQGYGFAWSGLSYQETQSAGQAPIVFASRFCSRTFFCCAI